MNYRIRNISFNCAFIRNTCFGLFLICSWGNLNAQTGKGNFIIGGDGKYKHTRSGRNTSDNILIQPQAGIFVSDKTIIGSALTYSLSFYRRNYASTYIGVSPYCRYYVMDRLFAQAGYSYAISTGSTYSWHDQFFSFRLGYDIFLNPFVALEPYLYVNYGLASTNVDYTYGSYGAYLSLQVFLESKKKKLLRLRSQKHWEK